MLGQRRKQPLAGAHRTAAGQKRRLPRLIVLFLWSESRLLFLMNPGQNLGHHSPSVLLALYLGQVSMLFGVIHESA